jgi:hypothetical protein
LSQKPSSRLQRRDERAARQPGNEQRRRRQRPGTTPVRGPESSLLSLKNILIGIGVVLIASMLIYAVTQVDNVDTGPSDAQKAQEDADPSIPGVYYPPHPGADAELNTRDDRLHYAPGTVIPICTQEQLDSGNLSDPLCYTSNPPTSGPHSSTPQGFTNLENPAPKENVVHSMEHGGVFVWYNTTDPAAIDLIKSVVTENEDRRRFVGSTIYTEMEPETIAITSWTRLDKFPVAELTKERLQTFIDANHKRFNPEGF